MTDPEFGSPAGYAVSAKCAVREEWKALVGRTFRHYKGRDYRLVGFAPHSETLEPLAVYHLLYGDFGLWARPAAMFFGEVEVDGRRMPRFALIRERAEEQPPALRPQPERGNT